MNRFSLLFRLSLSPDLWSEFIISSMVTRKIYLATLKSRPPVYKTFIKRFQIYWEGNLIFGEICRFKPNPSPHRKPHQPIEHCIIIQCAKKKHPYAHQSQRITSFSLITRPITMPRMRFTESRGNFDASTRRFAWIFHIPYFAFDFQARVEIVLRNACAPREREAVPGTLIRFRKYHCVPWGSRIHSLRTTLAARYLWGSFRFVFFWRFFKIYGCYCRLWYST